MSERIYLSAPHMGGTELKYIHEAFDTNWISTVGPQINAFESSLASYTGVDHVAALSSGTAAIHLALRILGVEKDDPVLCQSFTFAGSANPIMYQGAQPVFIDSEHESWNMDPNVLEDSLKHINASTHQRLPKAIIPVHLYGMPYNVDAIHEIATRYEIPVIEDAAEALGSRFNNLPCGSFGQFGILSFNGNKIITTSGGGALLSNNKEWIERAKFLATQARDAAPHYEHTTYGYNYRLGNINAAIGIGQMEVLNDRVERRREIYEIYKDGLAEYESIQFVGEPAGSYSNRWLTTVLTDSFETREKIRLSLESEDIECRPLWKPMHMQPVFKDSEYFGGTVSESLFEKGLCLPSGSNMSEEDLERVVLAIRKAIPPSLSPKGEADARKDAPSGAGGTRVEDEKMSTSPPRSPKGDASAREVAPSGAGGATVEDSEMPTTPLSPKGEIRARKTAPSGAGGAKAEEAQSPKEETSAEEDTPSGAGGTRAEDSEMHYGASGQLFSNARTLRENETSAEKLLWSFLRKKQTGVKFRRQHPLGDYIADFYCHSAKLVIEVDGAYHNHSEQKEYDKSRDQVMSQLGIKILRFNNNEIEQSIKRAVAQIQKELDNR